MKWIDSADADQWISPWCSRFQDSHLVNNSSDKSFVEDWKKMIKSHEWVSNKEEQEILREMLLSLARHYLTFVGPQGRVQDPVANFHLKNGASIGQINFLGDTSRRGMDEAAGLTVRMSLGDFRGFLTVVWCVGQLLLRTRKHFHQKCRISKPWNNTLHGLATIK